MFEIKMTTAELQQFINQMQASASLYGVPAVVATELYNQTVKNFEANGRPSWAGLSPVTKARRAALGYGSENILRMRNDLFKAITPFSGSDFAGVGVSHTAPYAAMQQFGAKKGQFGQSKRGNPLPWGDVPARPYIPIDKNGNLQPEAEDAVIGVVTHYLRSLGFG